MPEAQVDDCVIVHAGFAISLLDEDEALASLDLLRELGALEAELVTPLMAQADT